MKRNHKGLLLAAALFFAAMAAVSGYQLYKVSKEYKAGDEDLRQMYAAMESAGERAKEKTPEMSVGDGQDENREAGETAEAWEDKEASDVRKEEEEARLLQYRELKKANSDVAGWIRVDGTVIDYPVMQTPETPDFYLKRGFDKKYSAYGMIYMDEDCDLDAGCPNFVLYGHHMKNGSMFAALEKYTSEEFYREHSEIFFDTLEETGRYQVAAVFKMPGAQITEAFAGTLLAATEEDYNAFIAYAKKHSLYDTGVTPQWPEQLLTLGTCEYTYEDGRLFVVGRKAGHDGP